MSNRAATLHQERLCALISTLSLNPIRYIPAPEISSRKKFPRGIVDDVLGQDSLQMPLPSGNFPEMPGFRASGRRLAVLALVDLLVQQPGVDEMRLLVPALRAVANRRPVLLTPPHVPQALSLAAQGYPSSVHAIAASRAYGRLVVAAKQVLRSGSCGVLLFWPGQTSTSCGR
jgi:hypothetical protein